jgi:hypothetical protein
VEQSVFDSAELKLVLIPPYLSTTNPSDVRTSISNNPETDTTPGLRILLMINATIQDPVSSLRNPSVTVRTWLVT